MWRQRNSSYRYSAMNDILLGEACGINIRRSSPFIGRSHVELPNPFLPKNQVHQSISPKAFGTILPVANWHCATRPVIFVPRDEASFVSRTSDLGSTPHRGMSESRQGVRTVGRQDIFAVRRALLEWLEWLAVSQVAAAAAVSSHM